MKLIYVKDLQGGESLAKSIVLDGGITLISQGTIIKKEYIRQLLEIGIEKVYIHKIETLEDKDESKKKINSVYNELYMNIQEIYEKDIYANRTELKSIIPIASSLVELILDNNKINLVYQVNGYNNTRNRYDIYEHVLYVSILSLIMARKLNLNKEALNDIAIGSLLHDIGLRYISSDYMDCELKEMEPQQSFEYKRHTIYGYTAVEGENWLSNEAKNIVLFHHENMSGMGFPLKQKKLSTANKIVSLCNTLDSMVCGMGCRSHKIHEAVDCIVKERDKSFDGDFVDILLSYIPKYPTGTLVKTNENYVAIVTQQNMDCMERPRIRLIKNGYGEIIEDNTEINLKGSPDIYIQAILD